jgi:ABC-2 type transport system permease protein
VATSAALPAARGGDRSRTFELIGLIAARQLRLSWLILGKEVRELLVSRALWAMVLFGALLAGFSFIQAVHQYSDSSGSAARLPQLAVNLNPLDGIVVRIFSGVYLMNTFLLPFVAIRAIGNEKQTGSLKLALQLPVGIYRLVALKLIALFVGWAIALVPTASALVIWSLLLGGHLYWPELLSVLLGHTLYALVIAGISFLAAAITESASTAAIVALALTIGSWLLEFAGNTSTGLVRAIAGFSLTPALRGLEQGLVGSPTAIALAVLALGLLALTVVWLPPGVSRREKLLRSGAVAGVAAQALLLAVQLPIYADVTEDHRNSFNPADVRALRQMTRELKVNVNLATNDARFLDLQRNVLTKLQRTAPHVTITYAETSTSSLLGGTSGANYGLVTYTYGGKQGTSRATTAREVLPLIEALSGQTVVPDPVRAYPGYPLQTSADGAGVWFYGILPLLAVAAWWYFQQPPAVPGSVRVERAPVRSRWPWLEPHVPALRSGAIIFGAAFVLAQFVPYGRDHSNIAVAPLEPASNLAAQWCPTTFAPGTESTMSMGAFRAQVAGIQAGLNTALSALSTGDSGGARVQYGQVATSYAGVSKEVAELYPLRCPRLLSDRVSADSVLLGTQVDAAAAGPVLLALRAGIASVNADLDQRIALVSPNALVGNQDESAADAPRVTGSPTWDSQQTQDLTTRACAACHGNAPGWSWYANLAPLSWLVQHNVDSGRATFNLSEWDLPQPRAARAADAVLNGSMPPAWSAAIDARIQLSDAERLELARGLQATVAGSVANASVVTPSTASQDQFWFFVFVAVIVGALALTLVYLDRRRSRQEDIVRGLA